MNCIQVQIKLGLRHLYTLRRGCLAFIVFLARLLFLFRIDLDYLLWSHLAAIFQFREVKQGNLDLPNCFIILSSTSDAIDVLNRNFILAYVQLAYIVEHVHDLLLPLH